MKYQILVKLVNQRVWRKLSVSFKVKPVDSVMSAYVAQYANDHQVNPETVQHRVECADY